MATLLSDGARSAVLRALGISSIAEVLDKEFHDITATNDADRSLVVGLYADRNRGSVRINSGHFYTVSDMQARISRVRELKLP